MVGVAISTVASQNVLYQRTVAELEARASPFWLMFTPLAIDADPSAMARVVSNLRRRTAPREFEELATATLVMADADKRHRDLKSAILPHLEKETFMQSWVYKQGKAEGELKGKLEGKLETEANAVLRVLRARGLSVPDEVRERILACKDASQLETWLDRASVAGRVEDVLNGH